MSKLKIQRPTLNADGSTTYKEIANIAKYDGGVRVFKLMESDYIQPKFSLHDSITLKTGDMIDDADLGVFRFRSDHYKPTYNKDKGGFDYNPQIDAWYYLWSNRILKYRPTLPASETSFSLTGTLKMHIELLFANIKAWGETFRGEEVTFIIDAENVKNEAVFMSYENISWIDALNTLCDSDHFDCEWWFVDNILYLGKCEQEDSTYVEFTNGKNVNDMKPSDNQSGYATRLYAFGGTTNITSRYRKSLIYEVTDVKTYQYSQLLIKDATRALKSSYFKSKQKSLPASYSINNVQIVPATSKAHLVSYVSLPVTYGDAITVDLSKVETSCDLLNKNRLRVDPSETEYSLSVIAKYSITKSGTTSEVALATSASTNIGATLPNLNFSISEDKKTTAINWLRVYFVMDITIHNSNTAYVMAGYNGTFTPSNEYPSIITTLCFDGNNYTVTVNPDKSTDVDMEILLPAGLKMKAGDHYTLPDIISGTVPTGQFTDPQSDKVTYQGVVSDRLMLPSGTPYIDIKDITGVSVPTESIIEKVLVYDDIFPRITGHALTNVTSEVVEETDESTGAVTDKYVQYTVEDSTLTFDEDCIIPGYTVQMIFQTGDLAGQTLDVNYVNGKFIIVKDKDLDLPNTTLCPKVGDEYILTNIDTAYFTSEGSDTLVAAAEKELKTQVIEDGKKLMIDSANYECEMAAHYMYNKGDIRKFNLGQHVTLINPAYFGAENRKSRIIGYSFPLDYSYNKPTYIIGESVTYSKLGSMSKQIKSIQYNGNNYVVSGTTGGQSTGTVYTIVRYDDVKELTDSNVLSSKRAIKEIANRSLSRLHDDSAHGLITHFKKDKFLKGAQFGPVYREGVEGEGGSIDGQGNAEFGTVTARGSFTASEYSFNRISIIEGQEQMSPAIGTILSVYKNDNGAKVIRMKLEGDDYGSFKVDDMVRGMYNTCGLPGTQYVPIDKDGNKGSEITDASVDINGFPMRKGFYTSYFQVTSILTDNVYDAINNCRVFEFAYQNMDGWVDANGVEIEPCALMKIASYANPNDETRQGFHFRNSIGKRYYVIYTHCTTWQLHSWNVLKAFGEIKGMQFLVGGSTTETTTLDNDGTYEAGSFYINGELKNINPTTYDDITKKLKSYNVVASKRSDTINVDSVGNVIGGYWSVVTGADGNTYKAFKLNTAVSVFKADGTPLLLNGTQGDETDLVTEGQYAVYATGSDCTPMVKDGVVYIIAINNIHDGDATSHDSIDYDTMRAMKECVVTITVDCEGLGVRTIDYRVVINHKDTAYISAHLDNEVASISYNTKSASYLGLPMSTKAHMYHNNDELTLTGMTCSTSVKGLSISVNPSTGLLTISQATASVNDVIDNNVIIPIDVTTMYSGASYEQTLYFKLAKSADNNTYELKPSTSAINAVKTDDNTYVYSDGGKVSCGVKCTSTDDGVYDLTSSILSVRGFKMQYSFNEDNNGDSVDDRTYSDYTLGTSLDLTTHNEVSFRIIRISDNFPIDKQTIPVVRGGLNGVDGLDFEYVFCRQTSKPAAPDYTGDNKIAGSYTDAKGVVWYDHPQGIDDLHPQEWMAFRTSVNAADGSKTFKGQSFGHVQSWEADGDGLEYIYAINNSATTPPTLSQPTNYNTDATCQGDDYIPSGWADDSLVANISEQNPYCWRAMRKKSSGGLWGWFSTPKIAAYKAKDAAVLWLSDYLVTLPTDLNKLMLTAFTEAINMELRVPSVDGTMYETCSITAVTITRSDTGSKVSCTRSGSAINISTSKDASVDAESITIVATGTHNNATYHGQSVIKIVPNMTGADGDGFQNIFALSQENVSLSLTTAQKQSTSIPSGWTDDIQATTQEYPNLWQSVRTVSDNGTQGVVYGNWSDPKKVSHYGADAFSMELSNDASLFHVDYYGNNIDTSVETTKIYIKKSGIDDTSNWNLTAPSSCSINSNKELVVPVSLLTSDSNTFKVTGTRTISGILRTLTKNYTVKKHYDGRDSDEEESIYQIVDEGSDVSDDASLWDASQKTDTEILANHTNWTDEPVAMNKGQVTYRSTRYKEDGTLNSVKGKYWGKFSSPIIVFRNPVDPYNSVTVCMYKRSSTAPTSLPTGITYTFSTKSVTGTLNGWSLTEPTGSDNLYMTMATAYSNTDTDVIADSEWIAPIKMTGDDGNGITGTAVSYQASSSGKDVPSGTWYDSVSNTGIKQGMYLWTRIIYSYSNGTSKTTYSVGYMGTDGVAFNCAPSAFIIETYNNGVPKAAGSQNFTFTATKKSTDLTPGSVNATESESTDTSWDTGTAGILKLSWDNSNALVSHIITASVTFKDSDNNSYSHDFIIPITLSKQGDAGAAAVSYELQTNVDAFTFSLGDNAINWGNTVTDNPTITPSKVVASENSITCVAKKRIGQQAATTYTAGALYFVTSANTAKDAETLYSSINSGAGLINLNTNYYQCSFIEFRLYDSTSKTTLLATKAVNINYDTTAYFAKLKEAIVGSIADGKGGIASFFNMNKDGLHFGANTIVNTAITSIFTMMESAIADKALELIAKNTSYNVINDKADMSDWTNTGATISSSNGYNGYGAYLPTNSGTTYKDYLVKNLYLKADSLYILEFYAKGTDANSQLDSYVYPNVNARIVSVNVDAVNYVQDESDTFCRWSLTTDWKKYVVVFKTLPTMTETEQKSILFRLLAGKTACYVSNVKLSLSSYLVGALSGTTEISGGLILSNLMGVRDATGKVQAYMNGLLSKAYAMALGITNFGTENEDSMTHFAFDGSAKIGNLQVKSDGTTYLIDKNKIQRVLLSPDELDSLANLTANVGQTSNYSASANSITASTYGGYTNSVNLCSAFTVQYAGSTISYSAFSLYANINKGYNLNVVVELTNGTYTTQIASLQLDAIDNKTMNVQSGTIYGIPAGSYYFRLRAEMYTGTNIDFYVSSSAFSGVVSKTNNDQIQGIFARDGFASVYGPKQYTYVKQGLLYAGGWPQISGILLSGTVTRYGGKSSAYTFRGPLTNYTTTSVSLITSSDPHRYRVTFGTALKSNDYNIIATSVYDSTTDGRSAVIFARWPSYFEVYINDGGDGTATDTGFSFILVGDLMTLTKD